MRASHGQLAGMSSLSFSSRASLRQSSALQSQRLHAYVTLRDRTPSESLPSAGINDCTAPKTGTPKCGPTHGQYQDGQSYLVRCMWPHSCQSSGLYLCSLMVIPWQCVSLDSENLEAVAKVLRGDGLVVFAGDMAGAADDLPNVAALIDGDRRGDCVTGTAPGNGSAWRFTRMGNPSSVCQGPVTTMSPSRKQVNPS